jgi:Major Facilitator Superfamily
LRYCRLTHIESINQSIKSNQINQSKMSSNMMANNPSESSVEAGEDREGGIPVESKELHATTTMSDPSLAGSTNLLVEFQLEPLEQEAKRVREEWEMCARDPFKSSPQSKYKRYDIPVDHAEGDRATLIKMFSIKRPHMRGLHCAWISFFLAFMIWFAPAPLLKEIQDTLGLSKEEIWTSNITNDCAAIFMRIVMGPVCDNFGARWPMAIILMVAAIPTAMLGLVNSGKGLALIRLFIGIAGSSFVMAQFWPSRMFARDIAGTTNGIVGK